MMPTNARDIRTPSDSGPAVLTTTKPWWFSKTLWLNAVVFLIALVGTLMGPEFAEILPKDWGKHLLALTAILNLVLRSLTKQPLTQTTES